MSAQANVHLIVGEDDYLVEAAAKRILEAAVEPALRTTAVEIVNGSAGNAEEQLASLNACRASLDTPPFLDPVKLTWWRGVDFLPGSGRAGSPSAEVKAALESFAKNLAAHPLPDNQVFILTATKLLATSIFSKTFAGFAAVITFAGATKNKDREEAARQRLPDLAEEAGIKFEDGADVAFLAKVGTDTRFIVSELAKLRTYLGNESRAVTKADVANISSPGGEEPEFWDVTDALAQRNPTKLLAALKSFEGENGFGILLSTIAEKFFRELVVFRDAVDNKWLTPYGGWAKNLPDEVKQDLDDAGIGPGSGKNPWLVKRAAQNARAYTLNELRVARFRMLQVREKLVSSTATDALVSQELLRVIAKPRRTV